MHLLMQLTHLAALLGVSHATVQSWVASGRYPVVENAQGQPAIPYAALRQVPEVAAMAESRWEEELAVKPAREYTSVELFSGAGGLALGLEQAGFRHLLLNEIDADAGGTLRANRREWNAQICDVHSLDFTFLHGSVDLLAGGFPCQAFSYAGKKRGFADTRGTLFFELARAMQEIAPRVVLLENVRGLLSHDRGRTYSAILQTVKELGYRVIDARVLNALMYKVPQRRERLMLVAVRDDEASGARFAWPSPYARVVTLRDALRAGPLYGCDVPASEGQQYAPRKAAIMALVPEGGYWRDLPDALQREYLGGSYSLPGGKTGIARRLAWCDPSLTLTCAPSQKQTERCHPEETRPLTVREYARIQTFPDSWQFVGSIASRYRQIGNAVPVNMGAAVGRSLVRMLNAMGER